MSIDLGIPANCASTLRSAIRYFEEQESGIVSTYPFHYSDAELLMAGEYDRWDSYDQYDEEAFGVLPPIDYEGAL